MSLRDYQTATLDQIRDACRFGLRRILVCLPTGAGKTIILREVIRGAVAKNHRVVACVHRRELVDQLSAKLAAVDVPHGIILAGKPRTQHPVQVCSIPTLIAGGETPEADVLLVDEAHHGPAETWRAIVGSYQGRLKLLLGVTATPERPDGQPMGEVFERLIAPVSVAKLMALGFLTPYELFAPATKQKRAWSSLTAYQKYASGRKAIVFCASVDEARDVAETFSRAGIPAANVDGRISTAEREQRLADLAAGRLLVVTNKDILTEGWDCKTLGLDVAGLVRGAACILANGCDSAAGFLQRVGRVLRPVGELAAPGEIATIIDSRGCVYDHGLPDEIRTYTLDGRALSKPADRLALCSCRRCGCVYRLGPPRCPSCKAALPRAQIPAVGFAPLRRITDADIGADLATKRRAFETWREHPEAEKHGRVWIAAQYRMRFGADVPKTWWTPTEVKVSVAEEPKRRRFCELVHQYRRGERSSGSVRFTIVNEFGRPPHWRFESVPNEEAACA